MSAAPRARLLEAIDRLADVPLLFVADLVLDEFEYGEIDRVSREAPVLILSHRRTDRLPGGGANAASNARALDGRILVIGRVGADEAGGRLVELLDERGLDTTRIWRDPAYRTPVKRRVLAGSPHSVKQQIVRMDSGGGPPVPLDGSPLLQAVRAAAGAVRGAVVSDYSLGLLNEATIPALLDAVRAADVPVFVDSRSQLMRFRGITAATPNLQEAEALRGGRAGDDRGRMERAGAALLESLGAESLVLTRGSQGMSVFRRGAAPLHLAVYGTDEVADVTGAGDTVIAAFALASAAGVGAEDAARLANYAGGLVVMKRGTATVSREEIRRAVLTDPGLEGRG